MIPLYSLQVSMNFGEDTTGHCAATQYVFNCLVWEIWNVGQLRKLIEGCKSVPIFQLLEYSLIIWSPTTSKIGIVLKGENNNIF